MDRAGTWMMGGIPGVCDEMSIMRLDRREEVHLMLISPGGTIAMEVACKRRRRPIGYGTSHG